MSQVEWIHRPQLDQPVLIVAFEGWNDAADAATGAADHLLRIGAAERFAAIDPEDFFDFTATRPVSRLDGDGRRELHWPTNAFSSLTLPGGPDIVVLRGVEPQLRWRTFCSQVIEVCTALRVRLVLTLGSLLADVAHTRPTPVFGTAEDERVIEALHLERSRYEGPTGIVGVLHQCCAEAGVNSAALWAAVPSYVAAAPSPKAALALVDRTTALLGLTVDVDDLKLSTVAYEHQISELVTEDDETAAYVGHLEAAHDTDEVAVSSADDLVAEVERFLRDQRGS